MKHSYGNFSLSVTLILMFIGLLFNTVKAQKKQRYANLKEAIEEGSKLHGSFGPADIRSIDEGNRYS